MKTVRIYTGDDQKSHFEKIELSFRGDQAILTVDSRPASEASFRCAPAGTFIDWHPAPRRQYVVTLSGEWDIECRDGSVQRFKAGDVMLADDLTGQGHTARVFGDEPHIFMTVPLAD